MTDHKDYPVRDAGDRWFVCIDLLCIIGLIAAGIILHAACESMRADRKPCVSAQRSGLHTLVLFIVMPVIAVIVSRRRAGGCLLSAMVTGRKLLDAPSAAGSGTWK